MGGAIVRLSRLGASTPVAVLALVAANAVPLLGVLWLGWDVTTILLLYWLENGVVGLLNVPRILLAAKPSARSSTPSRLYTAAFFVLHYGLFWFVHGIFVSTLTGRGVAFGLFEPLRMALAEPAVLIGGVALLASHLVSLLSNYIGQREYLGVSPEAQMWQPYARMVVLHATIILGAFFVLQADQPVMLVVLLVVVKTALDLGLHAVDHLRARQRVATETSPSGGSA